MVLERLDDLGVAELEQPPALLDDRHLGAERGEHRGVLDADHAGADDHQRGRDPARGRGCRRSRGRCGRRTRRRRPGRARCRRRSRSCWPVTTRSLAAVAAVDDSVCGSTKRAVAGEHRHLVAAQLAADDVDLALDRRAGCAQNRSSLVMSLLDAVGSGRRCRAGSCRSGRATASRSVFDGIVPVFVHTPPTMSPRSIDGDAPAELGGLDRGPLPCRAGADHEQVVVVRHLGGYRPRGPAVQSWAAVTFPCK